MKSENTAMIAEMIDFWNSTSLTNKEGITFKYTTPGGAVVEFERTPKSISEAKARALKNSGIQE